MQQLRLVCKLTLSSPAPSLRSDTALEVAALSLSHAEAVSAVVDAMGTGAAETLEPEQLRFVLLPVLTAACVMAHSASDTWRLLDMAAEAVMARLLQVGGT